MDWKAKLTEWSVKYEIKLLPPVSGPEQVAAWSLLKNLPHDVQSFYQSTNGLRFEWLHVLPIETKADIKRTWNSIVRANRPQHSTHLGGDPELLARFVIVAEIGAGNCACIDRADGSIWFEDGKGLNQTDMTFCEFIEASLREVAES